MQVLGRLKYGWLPAVVAAGAIPRGGTMADSLESPSQEFDLVQACRRGEVSAYEELYRTYGARMKSLAANLLGGDLGDAEDAVQETFIRVYRGVAGFKGDSALGTWIYRILVNTCHDLSRRRRRRQFESSQPLDEREFDAPRSPASNHPLRMAIEDALKKLRPRHRMAFVLYEVEGFRHREIAQILETSEGNSKQLVFAARRELQTLLRKKVASGTK